MKGDVPPLALKDWLKAVPTAPFRVAPLDGARLNVGAAIVKLSEVLVWLKGPVPVLLSVTLTVKLKVPAAVGVPEICPAALRLRPAGKLPVAIA